MWRSIARFCSAAFALSALAFSVSQAGCGNKTKEVDSALPPTKSAQVVPVQQAEPAQTEPAAQNPKPQIEPTFFPGSKSGKFIPASTPTSQKKKSTTNNNNNPIVLPPSKSGNFFAPQGQ